VRKDIAGPFNLADKCQGRVARESISGPPNSHPRSDSTFLPFSSFLWPTSGFYDQVLPRTETEDGLYRLLAKVTGKDASYLASKWREPSITIHAIEASSPGSERSRLDNQLPSTLTLVSRSHCYSIPCTGTSIPSHSS
jgi:hypothetical protein